MSTTAAAPAPSAPGPPLGDVPALLADEPALAEVRGRRQAVLAAAETARSLTLAHLAGGTRTPLLVACPTTADAERLVHDLGAYLGPDAVELFPAWETLPFERVSPAVETMGRRLRVVWRLRHAAHAPRVVVAPVRALVQRLGPHVDDVEPLIVRPGQQLDRDEVVATLVAAGYRREPQVEARGEVAVRGSIVDVFPSTEDRPVRIDLWGDEVDRLTEFSVTDQRATDPVRAAAIFPCRELLPTDDVRERAAALVASQPWGREHWERLAEGLVFDGMESWLPWLTDGEHLVLDLLGADAQVVLVEPRRMRDRAGDILAEETDLATHLARSTWDVPEGTGIPSLHLPFDRLLAHTDSPVWTLANVADSPEVPVVTSIGWNPAVGDGAGLVGQARDLVGDGYRLVVAADTPGSAERIGGLLREHGLDPDVRVASLDRGCILPGARVAVLAETDLTGRRRPHRPPRTRRRDSAGFFEDLRPGAFVVHHQHGVARYGGMVTRTIGGAERDYLLLEYRGGDKLYVPSDQIDAVRHYSGGEDPTPSRLGGGDWQKAKAKVRAEVSHVAQELVVLYQKRLNTQGFAFPEDTPWQQELEDSFPHRETPDQLKAITDVKADMEAERPMDRLVCGDVGFGKTEIALRAAFKAVQEGKQVAVLVPTTLLAQQHFATFSDRFAGYPVRVEVLSRFLTAGQAKEVTEGLRTGDVDLVVGTHRLLSQDITFKDLGLLVVDEEQRFGVGHKEKIKALKTDLDVLTLSATPIPRTLEMSLTGIRDLTLLHTAPAERQPILTYVGEYDERAASEAIRRELLREGQVFFVHNRVRDIEKKAAELRELVPEALIAVAHGQMDEGTLEQVVFDFWEGRFDVLVCTTIIESGIDMPTVNTLVVDRADRLGLGQLHQLRGRVGRAGQRAYAYLFHPADVALSEEAYERLKTIGEATELGSGFRIAMRDLEIRGAGSLLGTGQSGHIAAVGYDLYVQMVSEAVAELKGEEVREPAEVKLDLPLDAHLPEDYVPREDLRLEAYRRLATVTARDQVDDIRAEWEDRYGPVPDPAGQLLEIARLRVEAHRIGAREINVTKGPAFGGPAFTARISPVELKQSQEIRLQRLFKGAVYKEGQGLLVLPVPKTPDLAGTLVDLLRQLIPPA
ncbi:transcription-repair coupling factor [Iamia majanohamensis]|uniref:Transcription-repair-coupling factor n=1 Tax=Iamia majanohamensis TaxID=467976 RepID=A0AAF0BWS5_9ACTN|nr:transcription-repair coupling factor [Iamia majanohamensis]WCO68423.1 transcription-repair coupling factor [Iamia majanohamensis]